MDLTFLQFLVRQNTFLVFTIRSHITCLNHVITSFNVNFSLVLNFRVHQCHILQIVGVFKWGEVSGCGGSRRGRVVKIDDTHVLIDWLLHTCSLSVINSQVNIMAMLF